MKKRQEKMQFQSSAFLEIVNTVGAQPAESGGLLFGSRKDFIVRKFLFDKNANVTRTSYTFDVGYLNPEIKRLWEEEGLELLGFLHSHPAWKR